MTWCALFHKIHGVQTTTKKTQSKSTREPRVAWQCTIDTTKSWSGMIMNPACRSSVASMVPLRSWSNTLQVHRTRRGHTQRHNDNVTSHES